MDEKNFQKICRTCVTEKNEMLNICTSVNCNGNVVQIINILNVFVRSEITEHDGFPNLVCSNCVDLAIMVYNFKLQCDRSHIYLEKLFGPTIIKEEYDSSVDTALVNDEPTDVIVKEEDKTELKLINDRVLSSDVSSIKKATGKNPFIRKSKRTKEINAESKILNGFQSLNNQVTTEMGSLFFCSRCNKSFKNKYIFTAHEKRHEFKGQFLCNVCGKGFSSQSCLTRHNRVHTGEKNYECKECYKRFPSSNNLNLHSRIHSGHKPYLCTVCGKRFSHPTGLTYHMRTHTNEKPYSCELCGKRFTTQCLFERHKKTHSGERPFPCKQCEKAFIKKIDLQRHEEIHTGVKPHSCTICKKSFLRVKNLKFHMMLHTEERPHICGDCGKGFIRSYYLKDHIKKHHLN